MSISSEYGKVAQKYPILKQHSETKRNVKIIEKVQLVQKILHFLFTKNGNKLRQIKNSGLNSFSVFDFTFHFCKCSFKITQFFIYKLQIKFAVTLVQSFSLVKNLKIEKRKSYHCLQCETLRNIIIISSLDFDFSVVIGCSENAGSGCGIRGADCDSTKTEKKLKKNNNNKTAKIKRKTKENS